jgi:glycosyltransferase involved in cell wall biosynthesis
MKIGIDAFWYFDGYSSLQRVTLNLINNLLLYDKENDYVVFLDRRFEKEKFPHGPNSRVSLRYLETGSLRYNLFMKLFILPYYSYQDKIDIFITQYYSSPFSRGKRIAFIYDILYESYPHLFTKQERYQLWPQKILSRMAHYIITISESEKKRLLQFKYAKRPDQIAVFPLTAHEQFKSKNLFTEGEIIRVKERYQLPDEFLLYVGLMSGRKNLDNLLRALPYLSVPIPLVITGNRHPSYPSNHLTIIEELKLENRVLFTGFVDDTDLKIIYALAKVFCFPSLAEGFGLPPLESLSAGVPVAVSNRTSLPEVCGEAGVYFNPEKPIEIGDAINKLLNDPDFYQYKKSLCIAQSAQFNWKESAITLIDLFNSIKIDLNHG